jgi:L-ascorbate metabolism protein UlaG (beta-lactamase superfamily)
MYSDGDRPALAPDFRDLAPAAGRPGAAPRHAASGPSGRLPVALGANHGGGDAPTAGSLPPAGGDDDAWLARRRRELALAHARRRTPRHLSLLLRWLGSWLRAPRRAEFEPLPDIAPGQLGLRYGGHVSLQIRYAGVDIAYNPLLRGHIRGVRRAVEPGLTLDELAAAELVLIGHTAPDHLDRGTLRHLSRTATVVVPPGAGALLRRLDFAQVVELAPGQALAHRGVTVTGIATRDDRPLPGLAFAVRGDGPSLFLCSASGYFSGFVEAGRQHRPDVAVLPIGGYAPGSFRRRHLSPLDALCAFGDLQARMLLPIGHGVFPLSYETLDDPGRWLNELVEQRQLEQFVVLLAPGQSRVFVPPRRPAAPASGAAPAPGTSGDRRGDAANAGR